MAEQTAHICTLNFATWNATGIMSSASYLSDFLTDHRIDICGVSEHWLYEHDLHFLNRINSQYMTHAVADPDLFLPSHRRVGKGGLCIFWHKRWCNNIQCLELNSKICSRYRTFWQLQAVTFTYFKYISRVKTIIWRHIRNAWKNLRTWYACTGIVERW